MMRSCRHSHLRPAGVGYNWPMSSPLLRRAPFAELTPFEVYALCRLRVDVFVVEQQCPYPELDGRDTEPATVHLWVEEDGRVLATLRLLDDGDRKSVVEGKSVDLGGRRIIKKK